MGASDKNDARRNIVAQKTKVSLVLADAYY
jgi:hypothetical protein